MFDSVLDRGNAPRTRFGAGVIGSVVLHVGLVGLALWLSSRVPEEKKEDAPVTFFAAPPPPPPPPPPASSHTKTHTEKKIKKPDTVVQPKEIPTEKPPEKEPEKEEEDNGGVEGGVEGGVKGGVVGGVIGGVVGGQLGGQLGSEVLPFGEGMTRPQLLEGRDPSYSREALEAHIQGLMIVKCVITVQGTLENCRIIKPLPHMEQAVLESLKTKKYRPVMFQGRPVAVDYVFNIKLVLPNR